MMTTAVNVTNTYYLNATHEKSRRAIPILFTVQSLLQSWPTLKHRLDQAPLKVNVVETHKDLLVAAEGSEVDIVVVDIDVIEVHESDLYAISGHRLVKLLTRRLAGRPIVLVALTAQDFAEIEDVARAGVRGLMQRDQDINYIVEYMQNALERIYR